MFNTPPQKQGGKGIMVKKTPFIQEDYFCEKFRNMLLDGI
jgi:hypothetical protein